MHEQNIQFGVKYWLEEKWNLKDKLFVESHDKLSEKDYKWNSNSGKKGRPDIIYYDESNNFILIIEVKPNVSQLEEAKKQIIRYLESDFIYNNNINIVGIAFAGNLENYYLHQINKKAKSKWKDSNISDFLDSMDSYKNLFNDHKNRVNIISKVQSLNNLLRNVISSEYRARLFCGVMICIYRREGIVNNFHKLYKDIPNEQIHMKIYNNIEDVLGQLQLETVKMEYVLNEFNFIKTQRDLFGWVGWKKIIKIINDIFLIMHNLNHDVVVTVFREMLRYASGDGKNFGEVMTPTHISDLAVDILNIFTPLNKDSVIFDPTCGTSGLLISAMDKILTKTRLSNKETIDFKENNLWGIEKDNKMFVYGITNMILNEDGKSNIFLEDTFKKSIKSEIKKKNRKASHILMNPPYSMKSIDKSSRNELAFLLRSIASSDANQGLAIIAPESTFRKEGLFKTQRNQILKKATLKGIIKLPANVFEPDASTQTVITFLDLSKPHNNEKDYIWYYDLQDDGLVKVKNSAREDINNLWENKKELILEDLKNTKSINLKFIDFKNKDNWVEPFELSDEFEITEQDFRDTILERLLFESNIEASWSKLKENQMKLKEFEIYLNSLKEKKNND